MLARAWVLLVLLLPWPVARAQETSMVPVIVDGQTLHLEASDSTSGVPQAL